MKLYRVRTTGEGGCWINFAENSFNDLKLPEGTVVCLLQKHDGDHLTILTEYGIAKTHFALHYNLIEPL